MYGGETLNGSLPEAQGILSQEMKKQVFFLNFMINKAQNLNYFDFMASLCCFASGRPVLKMSVESLRTILSTVSVRDSANISNAKKKKKKESQMCRCIV